MAKNKKTARMRALAQELPDMRKRALRLMRAGEPGAKQLGAAFGLVDQCHFRPGSTRALSRNGTYGATTLQREHVRRRGSSTEITFTGKAGVQNQCSLPPGPVSSALLSGGGRLTAPAARLNTFMNPFTAKDLRTWGANVQFLRSRRSGMTPREAIHAAAVHLSHKPSVCKKYYVLPRIQQADDRSVNEQVRKTQGLSKTESLLKKLLS